MCAKCTKTTDHSRTTDQYAGELWICNSCGYKTARDESKAWAQVTPEYTGSSHEELFNENMKNARFRKMVDFLHNVSLVGFGTPGQFTAAEKTRMAAIIVHNWNCTNEQIAAELEDAGFSLAGGMSTPADYVAYLKRPCESKYREIMSKKWWQFWK